MNPNASAGLRVLVGIVSVSCLAACTPKDKPPPPAGGAGTVAVTVGEDGFAPSAVTFKKGTPNAQLVFTRTTDKTCATEVVFPELGIKKELPKDTPVAIPIPTDKERSLGFQCGMGMYKSSVVVAAN
jgi:plastocyanin domain-containing protein